VPCGCEGEGPYLPHVPEALNPRTVLRPTQIDRSYGDIALNSPVMLAKAHVSIECTGTVILKRTFQAMLIAGVPKE
jgi:hypothetical protein